MKEWIRMGAVWETGYTEEGNGRKLSVWGFKFQLYFKHIMSDDCWAAILNRCGQTLPGMWTNKNNILCISIYLFSGAIHVSSASFLTPWSILVTWLVPPLVISLHDVLLVNKLVPLGFVKQLLRNCVSTIRHVWIKYSYWRCWLFMALTSSVSRCTSF